MDTIPFYRIFAAFPRPNGSTAGVFTPDGRVLSFNMGLRHPSYNPAGKKICGVYEKNGRETIGLTEAGAEEITPLFSLSGKELSHTALSPDNQKIAFIATDAATGESVLRVIMREEFGWFPMPFVKPAAVPAPVCFCTPDTLMFTGADGALNITLAARRPKTIPVRTNGTVPAYHAGARLTACVCDGRISITGGFFDEIEVENVTAQSFNRDGTALLFADANAVYSYDPALKKKTKLFETAEPACFVSEY